MIKYFRIFLSDLPRAEFIVHVLDIADKYMLKVYSMNDENLWEVSHLGKKYYVSYLTGIISNLGEQKLLKEKGVSKSGNIPRSS